MKSSLPRRKSHSYREEESLLSEKLSLKSNFLSLREKSSRSRPSPSKEKKDD